MKYLRIISGPVSSLSLLALAAPFQWFQISDYMTSIAISWIVVWFCFEIYRLVRKQTPPRILTHLRWGPCAVLLVALTTVVVFDQIQIYRSREMIRDYIYNGTEHSDPYWHLMMYNNYRGWCGNGAVAAYYETYINVATEGLQSNDVSTRLRSFKVSLDISRSENYETFEQLLHRALNDPDLRVRRFAWNYR